jgi:imidazolonepropionase-like amidohydrolase
MAYDLILSSGTVVDPANGVEGPRDVGIEDGRVTAVAEQLDPSAARRVIDVSGRVVMPGIIDTHVHVGGFGGRTRALGHRMVAETGVTTVLDMGSTMDALIAGVQDAGAGLNVATLLSSTAAFEERADVSGAEIESAVDAELERGAFGLKILGGALPADAGGDGAGD